MALTADGKIGKDAAHYPDWSGSADKKRFKEMSLNAGVVIMGSATYKTIGKPLPNRKNIVLTRQPNKIERRENLIFTNQEPFEILEGLAAEGFHQVALIGGAQINALFAKKGLIDEMILTYCPLVFGSGLSVFSEAVSLDLELLSLKHLEDHVFCAHYRVRKKSD